MTVPPAGGDRRSIDGNTAIWFTALGGKDVKDLVNEGLVDRKGDSLTLLEPFNRWNASKGDIGNFIAELLREKRFVNNDPKFRNPVDALHYLEYIALTRSSGEVKDAVNDLRGKTTYIDDAINMAKILGNLLPKSDTEKLACEELVRALGG